MEKQPNREKLEALLDRTFLIIKPEVVKAGKHEEIIKILEDNEFIVIRRKDFQFTEELARRFYASHEGKEFYEPLVKYMISGPVVGLELERENAVKALRELVGATNPSEAEPGTIRSRYGIDTRHNSVHAADSKESAEKELAIVFSGS
jgi:nucleoside-diphosphate kinase